MDKDSGQGCKSLQRLTVQSNGMCSLRVTRNRSLCTDAEKYGIQKTTQTEKLKEAVQEKIRVYQQTYDKPLQNQEMFEIGTLVWYADPLKKRSKLDPKWSDLATIIGMGFESYKILCKNGKQVIANGRLLKRVEGSFDAGECCNQ